MRNYRGIDVEVPTNMRSSQAVDIVGSSARPNLPTLVGDVSDSHVPSLKDMAAEHIRAAIVAGEMAPGEKVAQDEVADELGISRLPVREAVIELTAKGYLDSVPRRGAFVATLTEIDIVDHFEVIAALFSITARRAAENITDDQLAELHRRHEEILTQGDTPDSQRLEIEFYRFVNRIGSSPRMLSTIRFLATALPNDLYQMAKERRSTEEQHRGKLLSALQARDSDAAVKATREHIEQSCRVTIESLAARGYWSDTDGIEPAV